jgi:16S rRNA (cytosine967-C5)-methyltransferase
MGLTARGEPAGLAVRRLAVAALDRVIHGQRTLEDALAGLADIDDLEPRDRAFLMALVLTALRHKGEAEAVVEVFLAKPLPRKAGNAGLILMLGATQLLFLQQPPHAVIDLAVTQAKRDSQAMHFAGLVNAVLRKVATRGAEILAGLDGPRLNTPDWLWTRWSKTFGPAMAHAVARAHMAEPPLDLTVKGDGANWAKRLGAALLPTGSLRLSPAPPSVEALAGYGEGAWWVQDAAAAIPARLLGDVAGLAVLDLCAAPGGKTLQLAAAGARVTALDQSAARLARLAENLRRCRLEADVVTADALDFAPGQAFDAAVLDAPCSATGTIRRHPDLPYVKTAAQIGSLAEIQHRMLDHAATLVRPGGTLVYCTCSLEEAEGERQVSAFLSRQPAFALAPIHAGEAGLPPEMLNREGCFRTLPSMAIGPSIGLDGFFAARLTKSS